MLLTTEGILQFKLQLVQFVFLSALDYIIPIMVATFNYFQLSSILMLFKILAAAPRTPRSSDVTQVFSSARRRVQLTPANRSGV